MIINRCLSILGEYEDGKIKYIIKFNKFIN